MASNTLRNPRHELYAQLIVAGTPQGEAYIKCGYKDSKQGQQHLARRPEVKARIEQLMLQAAARCELSRKDILHRILEDWDTSRKLGQMAAALKAGHMLGSEIHKMFVDRKEIGEAGDFDKMSEQELRQVISEGIKDLGWEEDIIPPNKPLN